MPVPEGISVSSGSVARFAVGVFLCKSLCRLWLSSFSTHRPKGHFRGGAASLPFPGEEQVRVRLRYVIGRRNSQCLRRPVNPARGTFDFPENSNRRFIEHHMAGAAAPHRAVLFIAKRGHESERAKNRVHLLAALHRRLQFHPHFMASGRSLCFVGQNPLLAILAQPQELASLAQLLTGQIIERIHLVGGTGDQLEACALQCLDDRGPIANPKLDLDFLRHPEIITAKDAKSSNHRGRRGRGENGKWIFRVKKRFAGCPWSRLPGRIMIKLFSALSAYSAVKYFLSVRLQSVPAAGTSSCAAVRARRFAVSRSARR